MLKAILKIMKEEILNRIKEFYKFKFKVELYLNCNLQKVHHKSQKIFQIQIKNQNLKNQTQIILQ